MSSKSKSEPQQQQIDLSSLTAQNLTAVKKQLDEELEHLTASFQKLRAAQARFRECIKSVKDGVETQSEGKQILVPLTQSLYVPGTLADSKHVIVDVGTGYYVEKSTKDAITFYNKKVETLNTNLGDLEKIISQKSNNVKVVEDVLRQKMMTTQQSQPTAAA